MILLLISEMLFSEAIDKFIKWKEFQASKCTSQTYTQALRQFCVYAHNPHIEQVTVNNVMTYFDDMTQAGYAPNSFVIKAIALRKFLEFYEMQGYSVLDKRLIPVPKKEFHVPRVATEEEYSKVISIIPRNHDIRHVRNLAIINLLWDTGARIGEILSLDLNSLDFENKKALIKTEKNRGSRTHRQIFWSDNTSINLKKWLGRREALGEKRVFRDDEALFISCCGQAAGTRLTNTAAGVAMRGYSFKAGVPTLNPHSFRHRMGRMIIKQGGSNADVAGILGHSSLESTFCYTMMEGKELEERYRKFNPEELIKPSKSLMTMPFSGQTENGKN